VKLIHYPLAIFSIVGSFGFDSLTFVEPRHYGDRKYGNGSHDRSDRFGPPVHLVEAADDEDRAADGKPRPRDVVVHGQRASLAVTESLAVARSRRTPAHTAIGSATSAASPASMTTSTIHHDQVSTTLRMVRPAGNGREPDQGSVLHAVLLLARQQQLAVRWRKPHAAPPKSVRARGFDLDVPAALWAGPAFVQRTDP
jgi:hypothetical protein